MRDLWSNNFSWKEYEKSRKSRSTYNEYVEEYNELTKKYSSHTAVSVLSQNRIELQRKTIETADRVEKLTKQIYDELTVDNVEEGSDLEYLSNTLKFFVGDMDGEGFDIVNGPFKERLKYFIKQFCEENKNYYAPYLLEEFKELHETKKVHENLQIRYDSIEAIITEVLTNDYPKSLELKSVEQWKNESEESRGRPSKVDPEFVKKRVQELVDKALNKKPGYKKYWHFGGRYKDSPVKNQLKETIIGELPVEVDDSTVLRHIREAISELDL